MDTFTFFHVLLLPLCLCFDFEVTLVKTIGNKPDFTPICSNSTQNNDSIQLIVCKIRTERSSRNECRLLYIHGEDFVHECDSRFTLMKNNQTVFLHLTNLTSEDSGHYTCECSAPEGTSILHLNITVKVLQDEVEFEDASRTTRLHFLGVYIGGTILIITMGVFLGLICVTIHHGSRSPTSTLPVTSASLGEDDPDDPYTSLQHPVNDIYQTISSSANNVVTARFHNQEEIDPNCDIYENI